MWIDWDADGNYDNFYNGFGITNSPDTVGVNIMTPPGAAGGEVNVRLRADDDPIVEADSTGGKTNGEIEDFQAMLVLPVELTSFTGRAKDCTVQLDWSSATQENFSHYEIQLSKTGLSYSILEVIQGVENSNFEQQFQYIDQRPFKNNYYRLKMVDLDGSYQYSDVVNVNADCYNTVVNVYPNPVDYHGVINVDLETHSDKVEIMVIDMLGRVVKMVDIDVQPDALNTIPLDIHDLPAGSYMINVKGLFDGNVSKSKIFVIQD